MQALEENNTLGLRLPGKDGGDFQKAVMYTDL